MKAVHLLLTLKCLFECDHCFLFCGPEQKEVYSRKFLEEVIEQVGDMRGLEWIFFEGGEPFLYYPLLLAGIERAACRGLKTGLVTNGYWTVNEDADMWLEPLMEAGLSSISISSGDFHSDYMGRSANEEGMRISLERTADRLGLDISFLETVKPRLDEEGGLENGGVMFRGRAAEKLTEGLPPRPPQELDECPWEDLEDPDRVHIDPSGRVHLCQGLIIGKVNESTLSDVFVSYSPKDHPLIAPLLKGGPLALAEELQYDIGEGYVDACHFCFELRRDLVVAGRFRRYLNPAEVYGL